MVLEVVVDDGTCIGARSCVHSAPGVFALGPDGVAVVAKFSAVDEELLIGAAQACPNGAITVTVDGVTVWP